MFLSVNSKESAVTRSDDVESVSAVEGWRGPRRSWRRPRMLAATLVVMAGVAGVASLTQVTSASAATLGKVTVTVNLADANNEGADLDKARELCQSWWPNTTTVKFDHSETYVSPDGRPLYAGQIWNCLD
jgi:hypothetical protein